MQAVPFKIRLSASASLVLALILPVFAIAPLFYPGYFQVHSGLVPLWNVADLQANLGNLNWLPRIAIDFDPLRSDGLLSYYLASVLPFAPVTSLKMVLGLAWLLGSAGMVLWLKSWLGNPGALVAGLVYTYLPYRLATVYVRGAWGEALFWGLLPWAFLTTTYLVSVPKLPMLIVAALFWLLLGFSQLGLAIWAFAFITVLLLVVHLRRAPLPVLVALLGTAVAVALSFSLPARLSSQPVTFSDHFLYLFQLVSAYWGFGASQPGWSDGLSLQLGLAGVGLTIVAVVLWHRSGNQRVSGTDRRLIFFLAAAVILIVLQLGVAAFLWDIPLGPGYRLADTLIYPWQLLGLTGLCLAVLAGSALWLDEQLTRLPLFGAIIIFIVLASYPYLSPQFIQLRPYVESAPEAQLGSETQVTLLAHDFSVATNGYTAGLERGQATIPLVLHGPLQANDTLILNVVWHPLHTLTEDLKVFVHLVDPAGQVITQYDGHPRSGKYPTSQWVPGEFIPDSYPILVPADAPPGPYRVYLGLYDEATLTRLPVSSDSEGRVILHVE